METQSWKYLEPAGLADNKPKGNPAGYTAGNPARKLGRKPDRNPAGKSLEISGNTKMKISETSQTFL